MLTVIRALRLEKVRVVPASQSPLRIPVQGSSTQDRLAMVAAAVAGDDRLIVDERELERGGVSYTIDTIRSLRAESPRDDFYLIVGLDQFESFDQWKDYADILANVDLVVTSRPGLELPQDSDGFPGGLKPLIKKFSGKVANLTTGRSIHFVQLKDVEASATEIRRRLRDNFSVQDLVPAAVAGYIKDHGLYEKVSKSIGDFEMFTQQCAQWLLSKGAVNVQAYDLRELNAPAEFTIIASGTSTRHTAALGEFLGRQTKDQLGVWPQGLEGVGEGRWVVIDYGSLIIHIFYDYVRQEYRLEDLWKKGKAMPLDGSGKFAGRPVAPGKPVLTPS